MVFCIVALVVFGIMGIFSASHRKMAKEAFDCVFRMVTLRPCESKFDQKMKTKISVGLLKRNKALGAFVFRHFEAISWVLVILTVASIVLIGVGVYNFWAFGNCNGPGSGGFCIFSNLVPGTGIQSQQITGTPALSNGFLEGSPAAPLTVVEFGCFSCPYTKQAEPFVEQLLREYDGRVNVLWKPFPLPGHPYSTDAAMAAACASDQGKFEQYKQKLFENQLLFSENGERVFNDIALQLNLNLDSFSSCYQSKKFSSLIEESLSEGKKIGVYGTPTFFIGEKSLVGPKQYSELKDAVEAELKKRG